MASDEEPTFESFVEVQLEDVELNALDAHLTDHLAAALAQQQELLEQVQRFIARYGEAGRQALRAQLPPLAWKWMDELEGDLAAQLTEEL